MKAKLPLKSLNLKCSYLLFLYYFLLIVDRILYSFNSQEYNFFCCPLFNSTNWMGNPPLLRHSIPGGQFCARIIPKCLYKKYYAILLTDNYTDNLAFLWREISALGFVYFYIKGRYFYINGAIYVRTYRYLIIKIITIKFYYCAAAHLSH